MYVSAVHVVKHEALSYTAIHCSAQLGHQDFENIRVIPKILLSASSRWPLILNGMFLYFLLTAMLLVHAVGVFVENPWPPVVPHMREVKGSLVNVLLEASKKDYRYRRNSLNHDISNRNLDETTACKDIKETLNSNID